MSSKSQILVEFHNWKIHHFTFSLVINALAKKYNSQSVGFRSFNEDLKNQYFFIQIIKYIKFLFGNLFKFKTFRKYYSMGIKKIFIPSIHERHKKKSINFIKNFYKKKKISNKDILNLKVKDCYLGDIIYDSVLRSDNLITINPHTTYFKKKLFKFLSLYFFWQEYFKINKVKAVIVCHDTYLSAIPLRIASIKGIKAIVVELDRIWQLSKKNLHTHKENLSYHKIFRKFNRLKKNKFIKEAKKKYIKKIIQNKLHKNKNEKSKSNRKLKVLISPHSFADAPHVRGKTLFVDFYEWLIYLLNESKNTNYDWYIKLHPNYVDFFDDTFSLIKDLVKKKFRHVKWLSPKIKNYDLVKKKHIDACFTVHGSIGYEMALLNVPVINASLFNPHRNYNFNLHPKNLREFKRILNNLNKIDLNLNKNKILEYIFMNEMFFDKTWLGEEFNNFNSNTNFNFLTKKINNNDIFGKVDLIKVDKLLTLFFNSKNYCLLVNKSNIILNH